MPQIALTPSEFVEAAAVALSVPRAALCGPCRVRRLVQARQAVAYALGLRYSHLSDAAVGALLGGRHHTTVLHARRVVTSRFADNDGARATVDLLLEIGKGK